MFKFILRKFQIYSSTYRRYTKLVVLPLKMDFANDKDFCADFTAFLFQLALRLFFFAFDVRFLGTAIIFGFYLSSLFNLNLLYKIEFNLSRFLHITFKK